jgi:acetyl-CoA acyltransferase
MSEAMIVGAVRSAIGKRGGRLSAVHAVDLLAAVLQGLLDRTTVDPREVDDVVGGCVSQCGEQAVNVTRNAWIAAGLPWDVPAVTLDRQCGSGQQAIHFAAQGVQSGAYDLAIACGVESMSRVPLGSSMAGPGIPMGDSYFAAIGNQEFSQFLAAQEIAQRWRISREEMDELAVQSHHRAARATSEGRFQREIVPVKAPQADGSVEEVVSDEGIRPDASLERLAALPAVQPECPDLTAGNSAQVSDGAAAVLIASESKAAALGLVPRARFVGFSVAACDPVVMLQGPIPATKKILDRTSMSVDDFDVLECNEAMGSIVPMWAREFDVDMERVNPNGSGISLGHPVGASGARIMVTLLHELERTGGRFGFQTMCEGGGQGNGTIIERLG